MTDDELRELIDFPAARRHVTSVELVEAFLDRIESANPVINAFITVTDELARAGAAYNDRFRSQLLLPLAGMPVAFKDNIDVEGVPTTVGARVLASGPAVRDAHVVSQLRRAGAVVLGKTALHELGYGVTTNNPHFGPCRNPWDLDRVPGGSSGGSGAALGADLCIGALGSDTGGSVRVPAALAGVSALRPTFGLVSTRGVFPISRSFDTVGPMARSMSDVARLMLVIAGFDPLDPWAVDQSKTDLDAHGAFSFKGLRIGVPNEVFLEGSAPDVLRCVAGATEHMMAMGARRIELDLAAAGDPAAQFAVLTRAEVLALHDERLARQPELLGADVRQRLSLGRQISGVDFVNALHAQREWSWRLQHVFEKVDVIITPTVPVSPPRISDADVLNTTTVLTRLTCPWSLAHLPAATVPCGSDVRGLPIGMQLVGAPGQDGFLLRLGIAYQQVTDWHRQRPPSVGLSDS